ncbi:MAG: sugar ABC transporter ATP-binding protein [Verrucomicrobia bacterium]|nr:sugar ABC transporter ATP-binding protein [Verrucomicrobiota bacterium]
MQSISKSFPGVRALSQVSFRVEHSHIHALIGENGAGKSTLMKILDGVYPAGNFEGQILLDGKPVMFRSPFDARRQGIGYVPQEISVLEKLTVAENIFVGLWTEKGGTVVGFKRLFARAKELLDSIRVQLDPHRTVATLNASQRQLVMIARALATKPSVLILDEATACLTLDETKNLFGVVRHLRDQGLTTIFITHKMNELFEIADRATVLRDGAVVAEFDRSEFDQHTIVAAMVGRKIENFYPTRDSAIGDEEVLRVENLTVPHPHLARRNVVDGVSFAVRRGEILGFGGLVGSGRSETVNALYGRVEHTGRVYVEGREVRVATPQDAKAHGLGLLTEDRKLDGLLFNFAIRENMTLHDLPEVSHLRVLDRSRETEVADRYLKRLSIRAPSVETMVGNLSGGNQQKVVLAKVLFPKPRVLFLDEPTKGVDVGAKNEIYKLMMELAGQGIALVVISSDLPELLALCDRFIVLARGRVVDEFSKAEASDQRLMLAATG